MKKIVWKRHNGYLLILVSHLFEDNECKQCTHDEVHYLSLQ
jgi:hypothetical protein